MSSHHGDARAASSWSQAAVIAPISPLWQRHVLPLPRCPCLSSWELGRGTLHGKGILQMWSNEGPGNGERFLDCLGGSHVIPRVLRKGRQEGQGQRR